MTVLYSGQVQGVGFRYTAKTVATGFDLTGTIRNLADGRVELVAEGRREELEAFRAALLRCRSGWIYSRGEGRLVRCNQRVSGI